VLGSEIAGVVDEVGPGVVRDLHGRRVVTVRASAGYAEYAVAPADAVTPIPDGLPDDHAAAVLVQGLTALGVVRDAARIRPGETVLVQAAAGGVGTLLVQLVEAAGATVVAAAGSAAKLDLARRLGADIGVDYTRPDWVDEVRAAVGGGLDVVLETTGGDVADASLSLLEPVTGRMVVYGASSGTAPGFGPLDLVFPNLTVTGFALPPRLAMPGWYQDVAEDLLRRVADGRLEVVVDARVPLDEAARAHARLQDRSSIGKVLLVP
jgi:NADPH2:quinone reductase